MRSRSTSATRRPAASCASASPTSRSRSGSSSGACNSSRRRASSSATASTSASTSTAEELREQHDAVVLAVGARVPRDLPVPGRELDGVHFAMEYLYQRNRWVARELGPQVVGAPPAPVNVITAAGKHVIVVGGGDTGADCVGNAHREGAASVTQIELVGEPPERRPDDLTPWPSWPMKLRTSYALKEGGERDFAVSTTVLSGEQRPGRADPLDGEQRRAALRPHPRHGGGAARRPRPAGDGLPRAGAARARGVRRRGRRTGERASAGVRDERRRASSPPETPAAGSR